MFWVVASKDHDLDEGLDGLGTEMPMGGVANAVFARSKASLEEVKPYEILELDPLLASSPNYMCSSSDLAE